MAARQKGTPHYSTPDADRKSPRVTVTMPAEDVKALRAEAKRRGLAISALVVDAVRAWIARKEDP